MRRVGVVKELFRYPVKSMAGERLDSVEVGRRGMVGDRVWALRDEEGGAITGGKRLPVLMTCSARFLDPPGRDASRVSPRVAIELPDKTEVTSDDPLVHRRLSDLVGRKVTLCPLRAASDRRHYRAPRLGMKEMRRMFGVGATDPLPDFSVFPLAKLGQLSIFATPPGSYHDAYAMHLVTTASLAAMKRLAPQADFDVRRFRPSALIETDEIAPDADSESPDLREFGWCNATLRTGDAKLAIKIPTVRCSMPSRPQPGLGADTAVVKALAAHAARCIGVYADVGIPGRISVGDAVELFPAQSSRLAAFGQAPRTALKRLLLKAVAAVLPES
jgi:uncharacterized protein YcbX